MTWSVEMDPVDRAAADWFARLEDSTVSLDEVTAWQCWMRADPHHAAAFARMESTWHAIGGLSPQRIEAASAPEKPRFAKFALAASVVAAICALAWGSYWLLAARHPTLSTGVGENRELRLADGSRVTLGGHTKLVLHFNDRQRLVRIARGEALFSVAKDVTRPFEVQAGLTTITAIGTEFNVRRGEERVVVAVVEGRVAVARSEGMRSQAPIQLDAGQQTRVDKSGITIATRLSDPMSAVSWREGLLSFQSEPLRYVVEDVNRYAAKPIFIEDPRIAELRITGTVVNDNLSEWIGSLEKAFMLHAVEERDRIVLTSAR
jgi:transmembrane sensor